MIVGKFHWVAILIFFSNLTISPNDNVIWQRITLYTYRKKVRPHNKWASNEGFRFF